MRSTRRIRRATRSRRSACVRRPRENTFDNLEVDLAWDINDRFTLKVGVSSKEYDFETTELRRSNGTTANLEGNVTRASRHSAVAVQPRHQPRRTRGTRRTAPSLTLADSRRAQAPTRCSTSARSRSGRSPRSATTASVTEENDGVFVQLDFNAMLGSVAAARQRRRALRQDGPDVDRLSAGGERAGADDRRARL